MMNYILRIYLAIENKYLKAVFFASEFSFLFILSITLDDSQTNQSSQ